MRTPGAIRLFRVRGIPVEVRPSWFLVTGVIAYGFMGVVRNWFPELGGLGALAAGVLFALLIYASILLHEIAHTLVALGFRLPVRAITLQFLGGVSEIEQEPQTPVAGGSRSRSSGRWCPWGWAGRPWPRPPLWAAG